MVAVTGCGLLTAACGAGAGTGTATGPTDNHAADSTALRYANCLRTHGVPSFPDPTFPASGGALIGAPPTAFNGGSPAFKRAMAACGRPFG